MNIYAGNLSYDTTDADLRTAFSQYGTPCRFWMSLGYFAQVLAEIIGTYWVKDWLST